MNDLVSFSVRLAPASNAPHPLSIQRQPPRHSSPSNVSQSQICPSCLAACQPSFSSTLASLLFPSLKPLSFLGHFVLHARLARSPKRIRLSPRPFLSLSFFSGPFASRNVDSRYIYYL